MHSCWEGKANPTIVPFFFLHQHYWDWYVFLRVWVTYVLNLSFVHFSFPFFFLPHHIMLEDASRSATPRTLQRQFLIASWAFPYTSLDVCPRARNKEKRPLAPAVFVYFMHRWVYMALFVTPTSPWSYFGRWKVLHLCIFCLQFKNFRAKKKKISHLMFECVSVF